jgi:hypothetical protein
VSFSFRAQAKRRNKQKENSAEAHWQRYFDAGKGLLDVEVTSQLTHSIALKKKIATIY